jgi:hypothetical protein
MKKVVALLFIIFNVFLVISNINAADAENFEITARCTNFGEGGTVCRAALSNPIPQGIINSKVDITVDQVYLEDDEDLSICVTSDINLPAGSNLAACPQGSLTTVDVSKGDYNATQARTSQIITRSTYGFNKESIASRFLKHISNNNHAKRSVEEMMADEDMFLVPGSNYVIAAIDDEKNLDYEASLTINITGKYCPNGDVWDGNPNDENCVTPKAQSDNLFSVPANTNAFVNYGANGLTGATEVNFDMTTDDTGDVNFYVSNVYYPTETYALNSKDNQTFICQGKCGTWYVTVENTDDQKHNATIKVTTNPCPKNMIGPNCATNETNIQALKVSNNVTMRVDTITKLDDESVLKYWSIDHSAAPVGSYIRVSVANAKSTKAAPPLYIRAGDYPTQYQYDQMINTGVDVNQGVIYKNNANAQFYIAVGNTEDNDESFYVWAGPNCVDECNDSGSCSCNGGNCTNANIFNEPTSTLDSYGICSCEGDDTELFNCAAEDSSSSDGFWTTVNIIIIGFLILIGVVVVVGIVVAGVYFVKNKKRSDYETV